MRGLLTILFACSAFTSSACFAEKVVNIVLPFQYAGASGQTALFLKAKLLARGYDASITQKLGAGGDVGHRFLASAPADGATIGIVTSAAMDGLGMSFDGGKLTPLAVVGDQSFMLAAHAYSYATLQDFLYSRRDGLFGYVNVAHEKGFEMLTQNKAFLRVPYRSSSQLFLDLASGRIDVTFGATAGVLPFVGPGGVRLLAVSTSERLRRFPSVPTVQEEVKGFKFDSRMFIAMPSGASAATIQRYRSLLRSIISDSAAQDFFSDVLFISPVKSARKK